MLQYKILIDYKSDTDTIRVLHLIPFIWTKAFSCVKCYHSTAYSVKYTTQQTEWVVVNNTLNQRMDAVIGWTQKWSPGTKSNQIQEVVYWRSFNTLWLSWLFPLWYLVPTPNPRCRRQTSIWLQQWPTVKHVEDINFHCQLIKLKSIFNDKTRWSRQFGGSKSTVTKVNGCRPTVRPLFQADVLIARGGWHSGHLFNVLTIMGWCGPYMNTCVQ